MKDYQGQHFPGKMYYFWKPIFVAWMVKLAAKSTISMPLQNSCNEDDEHLIDETTVLSDIVCNLNKYENFYITEMMFI